MIPCSWVKKVILVESQIAQHRRKAPQLLELSPETELRCAFFRSHNRAVLAIESTMLRKGTNVRARNSPEPRRIAPFLRMRVPFTIHG